MKKKPAVGHDPLPPGLMRLAAVLAEIAQNEADSTPVEESTVEGKTERPDQDSPKEERK